MNLLLTFSKISLVFAVVLILNSLVFSLICFSVPDWLQYNYNGYPVKIGLWKICFGPITYFGRYSCNYWTHSQLETPGI